MISELKIELNKIIISKEHDTNHSYMINHLLENSEDDNVIYRTINVYDNIIKYNVTSKDIFLTKNGDKMRVICNVFLRDISNFFKNLSLI